MISHKCLEYINEILRELQENFRENMEKRLEFSCENYREIMEEHRRIF